MYQFLPLWPIHIFSKFLGVAVEGAPPLSLTPVANGKNLQSENF
jgi:hypothetical protein